MEAQSREELHSALQRLAIPPNPPSQKLFRITAVRDKGQGWKALKDIEQGTPIYDEKAIFWVWENTNTNNSHEQNHGGFAELSCPSSLNDPATPQRRFDVNNFEMGQGRKGRKKNGIFPITSRINHSCIPNAYFAWNPDLGPSGDKGRLTIYAIVLIPKCTEILIDYRTRDFSKTRLQRQTELSYCRFPCICPACEPNTEFGRASEQRRGQMQTLQDNIEQNGGPILPALRSQLLADIKALGLLLQQERLLYPQLADLYHQEVLWYSKEMEHVANWAESAEYKAGLLDEALQVARKKLDLDMVCNGHDSPVVKKTLKLIHDLKQE